MKRIWTFVLFIAVIFANCLFNSCASKQEPEERILELRHPEGEKIQCSEVWGYVNQWREGEYKQEFPITDVCYFAGDLNCYGEIIDAPKRNKLKVPDGVRVHFVMICDSVSLTHFVINPEFGMTDKIVKAIVKAAGDFDGLQLDFENIPKRDRKAYLNFVQAVRNELDAQGKNQMFSICVPGRLKFNPNEIIPYKEVGEICDRVFIMAYDEHWSTSEPGPIASTDWGKKVLDFAKTQIPLEKIVMGIPLYGRTWAEKSVARAWYYSGVQTLLEENNIVDVVYQDDIPSFTYDATVKVTGYFNDTYSLVNMCRLYTGPDFVEESEPCGEKSTGESTGEMIESEMVEGDVLEGDRPQNKQSAIKEGDRPQNNQIKKIGFWRIGFEPEDFWPWLEIVEE